MSEEVFGGTFSLGENPDPLAGTGEVTFGGAFALQAEGTFTQPFGGRFALEEEQDAETSVTIRVHPTGGYLVAMPLLHAIGGQLVDTVTGQPWEAPE